MLNTLEIEIVDNLSYGEKPVIIVVCGVKQFRNCGIPMVKMIWRNYGIEKAMMQAKKFWGQNFKGGGEM